jgi:hypothetical protein
MKPRTLPDPTPVPTPVFTVRSPHFSQAPISRTLDHLDQVAEAHRSDAFDALVDLIVARAVIPLSPIDHVEVLDHALTVVHVRIVEGDDRGFAGWIPSAWLHADGTRLLAADHHPTRHAA